MIFTMFTLYTSLCLYSVLVLTILFDRSINRFQFFSIIKSLNLCYLISTWPIPLTFTGMIEQAIESLHINFQVILKSFIFSLKSLNLLKLYHSIVLHPCFSITVSKFYQKFSFKASNGSLLVYN